MSGIYQQIITILKQHGYALHRQGKAKALMSFGVKMVKTALVSHVQLNLGIQPIASSNKLVLSTKFNRPVLTHPSSAPELRR